MRIVGSCLVSAAALGVAIALRTSAAATCKGLSDEDSKFGEFLRMIMGESIADANFFSQLALLDTAMPWMSTCVASIDPMSVFSTIAISSDYATCNASISSFEMPDELTDDALRKTVCPFYGTTLMPCLNNVLVKALVDTMAGAGSCCDDMRAKIKSSFGSDLAAMASDALTKFGAAVCTVKTYKDAAGQTKSQACLTSLYESFMSDDTPEPMLTLLQLPTDQVCKAVSGQPFTTTLKTQAQFSWAAKGVDGFGICYEPLSDLFKMIGAYPMMDMSMEVNGSAVASMGDAFAQGKCLLADSVLAWVADMNSIPMKLAQVVDDVSALFGVSAMHLLGWDAPEGPASPTGSAASNATGTSVASQDEGHQSGNLTTILQSTMDQIRVVMPQMCFHLASGQTCDYGGATTTLSYKAETPAPSPAATTVKPSEKSQAGDFSLLLGVVFAITTIVSLSAL